MANKKVWILTGDIEFQTRVFLKEKDAQKAHEEILDEIFEYYYKNGDGDVSKESTYEEKCEFFLDYSDQFKDEVWLSEAELE